MTKKLICKSFKTLYKNLFLAPHLFDNCPLLMLHMWFDLFSPSQSPECYQKGIIFVNCNKIDGT